MFGNLFEAATSSGTLLDKVARYILLEATDPVKARVIIDRTIAQAEEILNANGGVPLPAELKQGLIAQLEVLRSPDVTEQLIAAARDFTAASATTAAADVAVVDVTPRHGRSELTKPKRLPMSMRGLF